MRFYPNILIADQPLEKGSDWFQPPVISQLSPSYFCLNGQIEATLSMEFDGYMPEPSVLVGRIQVQSTAEEPINLTLELVAILVPMRKGIPSRPEISGINHILVGQTGKLWPVLFMTGGPTAVSNPYPALQLPMVLLPNQTRTLTWSLVSKETQEESFETARRITGTPWHNPAKASVMRHKRDSIQIHTGMPDWDAAFSLSQTTALTHLVSPPGPRNETIFVRTRLPDQPSVQVPSDENLNDLTTLEAFHLAEVILPAHVETFSKVFETFLKRIDDQGHLHSQVNLSAFASNPMECPLLAQLCLAVYEIQEDKTFLTRAYPSLLRYSSAWLPENPREIATTCFRWENPDQVQMDTGLFLFDKWRSTGRGLDIQKVESPALLTMLMNEAIAMQKIFSILGEKAEQKRFEAFSKAMRKKLHTYWQGETKGFTYLDCQSQLTPPRELFYPSPAQENLEIKKHFSKPQRLQCHLYSEKEITRVCEVQFIGENPEGNRITENFQTPNIRWVSGIAHLTTQNLYKALEGISIQGLDPQDHFVIETADLSQTDITCLLPAFTGVLSKDQLQKVLDNWLNWKEPDLNFGIPETWQCLHPLPEDLSISVNVLWNSQILQALTNNGNQSYAANLFINLMTTIIRGLKTHEGFFPFYQQSNGQPSGNKNAIAGLLPIRLFLQISGIRLFSPERLALWGINPFPWPIEITWQGLSVRREGEQSWVTFPNGKTFHSHSQQPILLTMD